MTSAYAGRPDFVIVGVPCEAGVMLMASTELDEVELRYEAEYAEGYGIFALPRMERTRYFLTTQMRGYVMIMAASYPEAFARLFGQWSPTENPQDVLDAMRRAITKPALRAIEGGRS